MRKMLRTLFRVRPGAVRAGRAVRPAHVLLAVLLIVFAVGVGVTVSRAAPEEAAPQFRAAAGPDPQLSAAAPAAGGFFFFVV